MAHNGCGNHLPILKRQSRSEEKGLILILFDEFLMLLPGPLDAVGSGKHSNILIYQVNATTHQLSGAECIGHTFAIFP
jgi:hypothetical protein